MANISRRLYLKWLDGKKEVNSDEVLVLTTNSKTFVDIRIQADAFLNTQAETGVFPLQALDWAFAGQSESWIEHDGDRSICRARWKHEVDSRTRDASSVEDTGVMESLSDGSTLENGSMVNPATGKVCEYQEAWVDLPMSHDKSGQKLSMVLRINDPERALQGIVVMVAQFCQGILRYDNEISVESWHLVDDDWTRIVRIGRHFVPCSALFRHEMLDVGSQVTYGDATWVVSEKYNVEDPIT